MENKKNICIKLYLSLLYFDIKNKTYLTGRSRDTGENHEAVANMKANDDEEDASQIMQSVGNAVGVLKSKLSEYLDETLTAADNIPLECPEIDSQEAVTICLKMPSNFNESVTDTIAKAAHQYVVNFAIGDWFTITNKADAQDYTTLAGAQLEIIREAINRRVRPVRPDLKNLPPATDDDCGCGCKTVYE